MVGLNSPVVVEQSYHASVSEVWRAITEAELMRQWYFDKIPAFKAEVGFETRFNIHTGGRDFLHLWKVTEVVPRKRIKYDWSYESYPGKSFVLFELSEHKDGTTLKLTHQVTESFPQDIPEFTRESGIQGWTYFIQSALKTFLEKSFLGSDQPN